MEFSKAYGSYEAMMLGEQLENAARDFYNRVANSCVKYEVRGVFKELAEAAMEQQRIIRDEIEPLYTPEWYSDDDQRMMAEYLKSVEHQNIFPDPEDAPACEMVASDPVQAFEVGIKAQKQAVQYYGFLRDATRDENGRDVFDRLQKEAASQLEKLEKMKEKS